MLLESPGKTLDHPYLFALFTLSLQNCKVKLRDVPEMGYSHTNEVPSGELCIWSPSVTQGYFKSPEKTAEAKIDGWLHSGDIVTVGPNGAITVIDRLKNIFKL